MLNLKNTLEKTINNEKQVFKLKKNRNCQK